jgi:spore germination cell wall hydrolase CwlJ-like protein
MLKSVTAVKVTVMLVSVMAVAWLSKSAVDYKLSSLKNSTAAPSTITANVRERQLECLARNIYFEAGNEPFEGKVAVAQVTMNRVDSGNFAKDVCGVVYQKNIVYDRVLCQFSWYCEGKKYIKPQSNQAYDESMIAAKKVLLEGFRLPSLDRAMYYHADYVNPQWGKEKLIKIGRHIFYSDQPKTSNRKDI